MTSDTLTSPAAIDEDTTLSRNPLFARIDQQGPILTPEQQAMLATKAHAGCTKSRQQLIERNLRLVLSIARRLSPCDGHEFLDFIQAGTIGLIKAVDGFDPTKATFATYATWWIRQAIDRQRHEQRSLIHSPIEATQRIERQESHHWAQHGRRPTDEELAAATDTPIATVTDIRSARELRSLDAPIPGTSTGTTSGDFIVDLNVEDPLDAVARQDDLDDLRERLDVLPDRRRRIVAARFGLDDDEPKTLSAIARDMGMSLSTVRTQLSAAMDTLQTGSVPPPPDPLLESLVWPDELDSEVQRGHALLIDDRDLVIA